MTLGFSGEKPLFLQIAEMIENDILRGVLPEDEQVMSTNELARALNVNPNTAAKGISILFTEDILYKKRGVGMFVSKGARLKILQKRKNEFMQVFVKPLLREAKTIGISKEELENMILEGFE